MKRSFSAWHEGIPFYGPLFALGLGLALAGSYWSAPGRSWAGAVLLLLGACTLYFFRDPERSHDAEPNEVVSPADGKVTDVEPLESSPFYDGPCMRISVFLSVFDVHVNRAPMDGAVVQVTHQPGRFLDARNPESSVANEYNVVRFDTTYGLVTVRQISGLIARRIVCVCEPGDQLAKGERFGMIRFGSRTDVLLPRDAEVTVRPGDRVRAGADIVARLS